MRTVFAGLVVVFSVVSWSCKKDVGSGYKITGTVELSPQHDVYKAQGKLAVAEFGSKEIELTGTLTGLAAGNYLVHIHAPKGCSVIQQGGHDATNHHADLGIVTADASGVASVKAKTAGRLGGHEPMTGYCVVIYPPDTTTYVASGTIHTGSFGLSPK